MPKAGGLARAGAVPFAMATAVVVLSGAGASSYSATFTWPPGRFTAAPLCAIVNVGGTGSSAFYVMLSAAPDATGGTVLAVHRDGAVATLTSLTAHIIGVQMTPTGGAG